MAHPESARVVICGAGVIGAAVAYYLSLRGVAATVIERCGVACAASGKAGGFLALDWCDDSPLAPLARKSFQLHAELAQTLGVDYGYRRLTTLAVAASAQGLKGSYEVPEEAGLAGQAMVCLTLSWGHRPPPPRCIRPGLRTPCCRLPWRVAPSYG